MTTTYVELLNATRSEVEEALLSGKAPAEVVRELQEPMPNVLTIYRDLRDDGRLKAGNFVTPAPSLTEQIERQRPNGAVPAKPTHSPSPEVAQRIGDSTDLLVRASRIEDKRIQGALGRARKAMVDLAGLVEAWEGKSAARNRIARLEAELRVARAELTGRPTPPQRDGTRRQVGEPAACSKCGKVCANNTGRVAHERHCTAA